MTSNTTRYVFVYATRTCIFARHALNGSHPECRYKTLISLKHYFPSPEPSAGVGWGVWGRCSLRGHPASGARPRRPKRQWHKSLCRLCPVPDLQGAATEGRHPGPAGESSPRPQLPGAGVQQDPPLHIQNIHQYLKAHRAALSEVGYHLTVCPVLFVFSSQNNSFFTAVNCSLPFQSERGLILSCLYSKYEATACRGFALVNMKTGNRWKQLARLCPKATTSACKHL